MLKVSLRMVTVRPNGDPPNPESPKTTRNLIQFTHERVQMWASIAIVAAAIAVRPLPALSLLFRHGTGAAWLA